MTDNSLTKVMKGFRRLAASLGRWRNLLVVTVFVLLFSSIVYFSYKPRAMLSYRAEMPRPFVYHSDKDLQNFVLSAEDQNRPWCSKWAVVAPVDSQWASEAVRRQVRMRDWCLVMVFANNPSPKTYDTRWFSGEDGNKIVVVLSPQNKRDLAYDSEFVKACPWTYTGRKNIGYYYAVTHGARTIWDFTEQNILKFWIPGAAPPGAPSIDATLPDKNAMEVDVLVPKRHVYPTWNPYPALGAPTLPSWPRGLPLDDATNEKCNNVELKPSKVPKESITVLQSLSDHQPDADALYQSIMPFPFYFEGQRDMKPVMVPRFSMSPYNERATLHFETSFWALFLPTTMDSYISDVWRSYIAQRLFWEAGLSVGFTGRPLVVQDHDIHSSLDGFSKVKEMSDKTKKLITFLGSWRGQERSLIGQIKELWVALHENRFVSRDDHHLMDLWLQGLHDAEYKFPDLVESSDSESDKFHVYPDHNVLNSVFSQLCPKKFKTERYIVKRNSPEHDGIECRAQSTKSLTFWTSDLHFAARLDQPTFLGSMGHNVFIAVATYYNRNPFAFKMPGMHKYDRISEVLKKNFLRVNDMNNRITEQMIEDNFEFYKNDSEIANVDGFLCLFQPGMCEMWMPFNKSIIFLPCHRYNMGRCTSEEFSRLNEHLYTLARMEHPKHIIAASDKYDLEYIRHYTGLDVLPLYSQCIYVENNTYSYNSTREEIAIFDRDAYPYHNWDKRFETDIKGVKIIRMTKHFKHYLFSDLVQFRGIVFLPYAVMTYKMTELYTMSIPLFFPSMKYFQTIKAFGPDRSMLDMPWCQAVKSGTLKDTQMIADPSSIHPYSPNAFKDKESEFYWLQLADFVQWPHITYFDDFKDLEEKLLTADFERIHERMVEENRRKKKELKNNWCKVFKKIEKGREVPQNYTEAIHDLYDVSRLQVY